MVKSFKAVTPGRRHLVLVERGDLYKGGPVKSLTEGLSKTGGRNNDGHITSRRMGGGHKRRYRIIDFRRNKFDVAATKTVNRRTFWLRNVCRSAMLSFPVQKLTLNRAMPCC